MTDIVWSGVDRKPIERVIFSARELVQVCRSGIICFTTGDQADRFSQPMPRTPEPETGHLFCPEFPGDLEAAVELNPAVHDGAIICNRGSSALPYRISGWSHRLFPPFADSALVSNRGSAFNSAQAMSLVAGVDVVYFWSDDGVWRFVGGRAEVTSPAFGDMG